MATYYELLGVHSNASLSDIKQAYRNKAKRWHPDRNTSENATSMFQQLNTAFSVLVNPNKRQVYDDENRATSKKFTTDFLFHPMSFSSPLFEDQNVSSNATQSNYIPIKCTLEELFTGLVRKVKVARHRFNDGVLTKETREFTVTIPPGCPDSHLIVFPKEGDQCVDHSRPASDITFIIYEKPHPMF